MAYFADNPDCPSNFLSGVGFQFSLKKLPGVSFYCQSANVPSQNLSVAIQPTRFNAIPEPGDEVNYDDLTVRFLVDEDLKNYRSIHNWIRYLGHPEGEDDWSTYCDGETFQEKQYSDGVLFVLDSNFNKKFRIYFKDLFPVSLSGLNFDSTYTDTEYFAVDATFKFTIFDIEEVGATGFFTQNNQVIPTITLTHTIRDTDVLLTWTSENAQSVVIDNGVGEVELNGSGAVKFTDYANLTNFTAQPFTATAYGRGGTKATASTVVLRSAPTTNNNIVCIAVIDENSAGNLATMTARWAQFRTNWPNRKFYLLQPPQGCCGHDLRVPVDFLEKTEPSTYNGTR